MSVVIAPEDRKILDRGLQDGPPPITLRWVDPDVASSKKGSSKSTPQSREPSSSAQPQPSAPPASQLPPLPIPAAPSIKLVAPTDPKVGDRGTLYPAVKTRGLASEPRLHRVASKALGLNIPNVDDVDMGFFSDLVAEQSSEPISPRRAIAIKSRTGFNARNVTDPEAAAAALLGFEVILTVAAFIPPLSGPATVALLLLALAKGNKGEAVLTAVTLPFGAIGRLRQVHKLISPLAKPGLQRLTVVPNTVEEYKKLARFLIRNQPKAEAIAKTIVNVTEKELKVSEKAWAVYNAGLKAGLEHNQAAREAGNLYHKLVGAAKSGERVDFVLEGGKTIKELKTHYIPFLDRLVMYRANEQVLAYVLEDFVQKGVIRRGLVEHVFIGINSKGKVEAVKVIIDSLDGRLLSDFF